MKAVRLTALAALAAALTGCASGGEAASPGPATRPAAYAFCPRVAVASLPAGLRLVDAELPNLGGGVLGRSLVYSGGSRRLTIDVGFDRLEALDDIDFADHSALRLGARRVEVLRSQALGRGASVWAGTWEEPGARPPCQAVTVVGWRLSLAEFRAALAAVTVSA